MSNVLNFPVMDNREAERQAAMIAAQALRDETVELAAGSLRHIQKNLECLARCEPAVLQDAGVDDLDILGLWIQVKTQAARGGKL